MRRYLNISGALLCLCLFLAGCGDNPQRTSVAGDAADPAGLTQSALEKQRIGAYKEAVEILNRALAIDPQFVPALYRMGAVYEEWDRREEAIAAYRKVLAIDPDHTDARLGLGSVYSKATLNELAIKEYQKVAAARPDDPEIHFKIALEYWYVQQLPESAEHYRKVIAIDPGYMQAHLNLASVYERMKAWDKALAQIETALRLGRETGNTQAISIAEGKLKFLNGRVHMTQKEFDKKTQPPFN